MELDLSSTSPSVETSANLNPIPAPVWGPEGALTLAVRVQPVVEPR
jgi:hypothetical protein